MSAAAKDWSATRYLRFATERTRPVHDLITRLAPQITSSNPRIYDLGCGPGNSTAALLSAFPDAHVTGVDTSPDMLSKARAAVPDADFVASDVAAFAPDDAADLIFSNATFHWLRTAARVPTLRRLFDSLKPGGILAFQMPDNYHEPSHASMRATALMEGMPWSGEFAGARIGDLADEARPDIDPIESTETFYDALVQQAESVDVWKTTYMHVLAGPAAIVDWVRSTGLQPYVNMIRDEEAKKAFLKEYEKKIAECYSSMADGKVLLKYPRFFVVAVRK